MGLWLELGRNESLAVLGQDGMDAVGIGRYVRVRVRYVDHSVLKVRVRVTGESCPVPCESCPVSCESCPVRVRVTGVFRDRLWVLGLEPRMLRVKG